MVRLGLEQRVTGRERRHRKSLEQQMQGAVEHREYEKAAQLRDQLGQLGQSFSSGAVSGGRLWWSENTLDR